MRVETYLRLSDSSKCPRIRLPRKLTAIVWVKQVLTNCRYNERSFGPYKIESHAAFAPLLHLVVDARSEE